LNRTIYEPGKAWETSITELYQKYYSLEIILLVFLISYTFDICQALLRQLQTQSFYSLARFSIAACLCKTGLFLFKLFALMPDGSLEKEDSSKNRNAIWKTHGN